MGRFGAPAAGCGAKLLLLAALLAPAGFLAGDVWFAIAGLVLASLLVAWAVRRRHRCDGSCHVPESPQRVRVHPEH